MSEDRELTEARSITIYPTQWATVEAFAKDRGYPSVSSALRRIIDEWLDMKKQVRETPYGVSR